MKGMVSSWNEERGFGFIESDEREQKIFFHISSVKKATRKPRVGDAVIFELAQDQQGRLKATHVLLESVSLATTPFALVSQGQKPARIVTEPVRKDGLDYAAYTLVAVLLLMGVGILYKTAQWPPVLVLGALAWIVLTGINKRLKQPANKQFSCAKCRSVTQHGDRTVQAWNRGFTRLYCQPCHIAWLRTQPQIEYEKYEHSGYASQRRGCLGVLCLMTFAPALLGVAIWLS